MNFFKIGGHKIPPARGLIHPVFRGHLEAHGEAKRRRNELFRKVRSKTQQRAGESGSCKVRGAIMTTQERARKKPSSDFKIFFGDLPAKTHASRDQSWLARTIGIHIKATKGDTSKQSAHPLASQRNKAWPDQESHAKH